MNQRLWIVFRFCIFVLWTQSWYDGEHYEDVVNCFQILYIRSLNTMNFIRHWLRRSLWIVFRFCIFVLWTQSGRWKDHGNDGCELFSDFVYSFFEHNTTILLFNFFLVVNCFQILYIRSLNTMNSTMQGSRRWLWIVFRFCIFVLWTQSAILLRIASLVVNCFQILYIRSLNTISGPESKPFRTLWIVFRFCIFVLWTQLR